MSIANLQQRFIRPEILLMLLASAVPLSFATWSSLINNYVVDVAGMDGYAYGWLQSVREIPGFLAFAVVFVLLLIREQRLAIMSLILLGVGTAMTGFYVKPVSLLIVTFLMSIGYHYYETLQTSLSLQWIDKEKAAHTLGRLIAVGSFSSVIAFVLVYLGLQYFALSYQLLFIIGGALTILIALIAAFCFPLFPQHHTQNKRLVLRKRYWLYYLLTFLAGARRQIFMVFAGFMMVEKFNFSAASLTLLFLCNCIINIFLAPKIGQLVGKWGDRRSLVIEYTGLLVIFSCYALVAFSDASTTIALPSFLQFFAVEALPMSYIAALLYILDHIFFALSIAIKTYFQKIADPADIASTAGVAFTINHIAAVILPASLGLLWIYSNAMVFMVGSGLAALSIIASLLIPSRPTAGNEVDFGILNDGILRTKHNAQ